ncbi:hypothetical protein HRG_005534 [Hirsutella rhossiliensis]|uniref:DRBM domain-containing protein n=1 Tax=Hirsutella rhossiliensis TaxID=111463 RepID=A0A9P8MXK5_9HYPO|nr:uncharacterized protein HRG_05534 [Hirsutella rhossiliensis]KAH0963024.1 hypothetical protein HRG_05534 [Hirsutella rhossiliensis]
MESTSSPGTATTRVPWHRLRAWIDQQEDYERTHSRPAPLAQIKLEAISMLIPFGDDEPEVGDRDYVSLLLHETQTRRLSPPVFTDGEPALVPVDGHLQPKWSFVCSIAECGSFPRERHGIDAGQQPPAFQGKKNAKRYAAKCALQYLQQAVVKGAVPAATPPTKERAAAATQSPALSPSPARGVAAGGGGGGAAAADRSPRLQPQPSSGVPGCSECGSSNPDNGDEASVFRHVSDLATSLNLSSPRYEVVPDSEMPGFFRGCPVFSPADMVPRDLGLVSGVLGKKQARLQVAEKVLEWLEAERRKRRDVFDSLYRKKS